MGKADKGEAGHDAEILLCWSAAWACPKVDATETELGLQAPPRQASCILQHYPPSPHKASLLKAPHHLSVRGRTGSSQFLRPQFASSEAMTSLWFAFVSSHGRYLILQRQTKVTLEMKTFFDDTLADGAKLLLIHFPS